VRLLIVVLAIPASLLAWQWWSDRSTEQTLTPVVSVIAGRDVAVDCQSFWGSLIDPLIRHGEVRFDASGVPERRIFLTHQTCDRLAAFSSNGRHVELDCLRGIDWHAPSTFAPGHECYATATPTIYALLTLAHEAYHTAGVVNEAVTNCLATQSLGYAAAALGAPEDEALGAAAAMAALLPHQRGSYRTTECGAGSRLDLFPETPAFPNEVPIKPHAGKGGVEGLATGA